MTIRTLPEIKAFDPLPGLRFEPDADAMAKWRPEVRAAAEGDDNVISVYDVIGDDMFGDGVSSRRVAGALRRIGARDVTVNINSPGGDFFEGVAIYNLLRQHPHRVTVKIMGLAASAASVIAMAGDDIQIGEVGFMMIHNAWAVAMGDRHDMREAADMLEPFDAAMAGLYAARSGADKDEVAAWLDAETWFSGESAVEAGMADSILPAAEVSEAHASVSNSIAALRRVDVALAKQGLPRSERRALLEELTSGTPGAAAPATPGAGDDDTDAAIRSLIQTIQN